MAWRLALRIARREAWRSRGRSLMVAAMIALPVAGAGAADTLWRSTQVSTAEQATRDMGRYDAVVTAPRGTALYQNPQGDLTESVRDVAAAAAGGKLPPGPAATPTATSATTPTPTTAATPGPQSPQSAPAGDHPPDPSPAALAALLPPGSHVTPYHGLGGRQIAVTKGAGRIWSQLVAFDLTDPMTAGMTRHRSGTAPTAADQAAISTAEAKALGKSVGDQIELRNMDGDGKPHTYRVTGIFDLPDSLDARNVIVRPGPAEAAEPSRFLVSVPGGLGWDLVQQLNAHGYAAESRKVLENPPADADVPLYQHYREFGTAHDALKTTAVAIAAIAVAMVLLQIILLAGPAFAVGARRRRRDFGLLGAAGATGRQVRGIVLADGLVLGTAGAVLGVAVGVAASAAGYPWLSRDVSVEPGGFTVRPADLLAAAGVGMVTGVIAALAPAISTARLHVLQALTGRRGQTRTPWRLPLAGLVGIGAGTALVVYGAFGGRRSTLPVIAGIAVAELGVVACTPLLVAWSGRLARFLPLAGRLALRDGARNRGRTAPAVAAIMAAVAGTSAVAVVISTTDARNRAQYSTELRTGEAGIDLGGQPAGMAPGDLAAVVSAVTAALPTKEAVIEYQPDYSAGWPEIVRTAENLCPYHFLTPVEFEAGQAAYRADARCVSAGFRTTVMHHLSMAPIVVGGPELLRVLTGTSNPAAEQVLAAGGVVVFDAHDLTTTGSSPTVTLMTRRPPAATVPGDGLGSCRVLDPQAPLPAGCAGQQDQTVILPAVLLPPTRQGGQAIVSTAGFSKIGVPVTPMNVLFDTTRTPTAAEEAKADTAAGALGIQNQLYVERGYQGGTMLGLLALAAVAGVVTFGAAAVATGLAITDAQGDLETLAAVGARPRVRRTLAGSQAAVTAGLGSALGVVFGLLPAMGLVEIQAGGFSAAIAFGAGGSAQASAAHMKVPWLFLGIVILAVPALAALGAAAVTRSRIEMRRRRG